MKDSDLLRSIPFILADDLWDDLSHLCAKLQEMQDDITGFCPVCGEYHKNYGGKHFADCQLGKVLNRVRDYDNIERSGRLGATPTTQAKTKGGH